MTPEYMMALPPQLSDIKVKVNKEEHNGAPSCILDITVAKDSQKCQLEEYQLRLSPEVLTTTVDSLLKVRTQLDAIAHKTKA